jgi:hypothetical protein
MSDKDIAIGARVEWEGFKGVVASEPTVEVRFDGAQRPWHGRLNVPVSELKRVEESEGDE